MVHAFDPSSVCVCMRTCVCMCGVCIHVYTCGYIIEYKAREEFQNTQGYREILSGKKSQKSKIK